MATQEIDLVPRSIITGKYTAETLWRLYKRQVENFWTADRIDLNGDREHWKRAPREERQFVRRVVENLALAVAVSKQHDAACYNVCGILDAEAESSAAYDAIRRAMENIHLEALLAYLKAIDGDVHDDHHDEGNDSVSKQFASLLTAAATRFEATISEEQIDAYTYGNLSSVVGRSSDSDASDRSPILDCLSFSEASAETVARETLSDEAIWCEAIAKEAVTNQPVANKAIGSENFWIDVISNEAFWSEVARSEAEANDSVANEAGPIQVVAHEAAGIKALAVESVEALANEALFEKSVGWLRKWTTDEKSPIIRIAASAAFVETFFYPAFVTIYSLCEKNRVNLSGLLTLGELMLRDKSLQSTFAVSLFDRLRGKEAELENPIRNSTQRRTTNQIATVDRIVSVIINESEGEGDNQDEGENVSEREAGAARETESVGETKCGKRKSENRTLKRRITRCVREAADIEVMNFAEKIPRNAFGLNAESISSFVEYNCNRLLSRLFGFEEVSQSQKPLELLSNFTANRITVDEQRRDRVTAMKPADTSERIEASEERSRRREEAEESEEADLLLCRETYPYQFNSKLFGLLFGE